MTKPTASYPPPVPAYKRLLRRMVPEQARVRIWTGLASTPGVAEIYAILDPAARALRVTRRTDLVIDGCPRSGNTYAVAAFQHVNDPAHVALSHHFHSVRQIQRAVRIGVPAIVLIRNPRDVLGSLVQFSSAHQPSGVLTGYANYYGRVLPLVDRVVVADFEEVIADFGAVIERCNARFGTSFRPYARTPDGERAVTREIERIAAVHSPESFEAKVSRPSAERKDADLIVARLTPSDQALLTRARALYDEILSRSRADQEKRLGERVG